MVEEEKTLREAWTELKASTLSKGFRTILLRGSAIALVIVWGVPGPNQLWRGAVRGVWFFNARVERVKESVDKAIDKVAPDLSHVPKKGEVIIANGKDVPVSSGWGRRDELCKVTVASCNHKGIDLAPPAGTPVCLPGIPGEKVTYKWVTTGNSGGYGEKIEVYVPSYKTTFIMAHLQTNSGKLNVAGKENIEEQVDRLPIARVGSTGNSTGPHLHAGAIENGVLRPPTRKELTEMMCGNYDPTLYRDSK